MLRERRNRHSEYGTHNRSNGEVEGIVKRADDQDGALWFLVDSWFHQEPGYVEGGTLRLGPLLDMVVRCEDVANGGVDVDAEKKSGSARGQPGE